MGKLMASLTELANLHGSDKGTVGPSPEWQAHNYTDIYEAYMGPLRERPINLLEVGMGVPGPAWEAKIARGRNAGGGASIKMWYDYFPRASIYGIDINPASHLDNDRVRTFTVDQGDRGQLRSFAREVGVKFDVIIDDGSHRPDHQQLTLATLYPILAPGGLYFVEDLMANGRDDPDLGRFTSRSVLNTRHVLREFQTTGKFPRPNGFGSGNLAAEIESITFHAPKIGPTMRVTLRDGFSPRRAIRPMVRYVPGTEAVCLIRRVSAATPVT